MFSISLALKHSSAGWSLLFKTEDKASDVRSHLLAAVNTNSVVEVKDDFGHEMALRGEEIAGIVYEDMDKTALAHVERGVHHARVQAKGQQRLQSEPGLRPVTQGPGIIDPINGRMRAF